jgi:hypothetical protein
VIIAKEIGQEIVIVKISGRRAAIDDAAYRVYICKPPQELIALNLSESARIYVHGRRIIHTGYRGSPHGLCFGRLGWNRISTCGRFADAQDRKKKIKKSRDKRDFSNHLAAPI